MFFCPPLINKRLAAGVIVMTAGLLLPATTFAYVGPGAGLTAIGTILALISAVLLSIVGFVWYPIKRILRKLKSSSADHTGSGGTPTDNS
jgi:hypothetical protein